MVRSRILLALLLQVCKNDYLRKWGEGGGSSKDSREDSGKKFGGVKEAGEEKKIHNIRFFLIHKFSSSFVKSLKKRTGMELTAWTNGPTPTLSVYIWAVGICQNKKQQQPTHTMNKINALLTTCQNTSVQIGSSQKVQCNPTGKYWRKSSKEAKKAGGLSRLPICISIK